MKTITIICDGLGCSEEREKIGEIDSLPDGWLEDPNCSDFHYCPRCAPKVKEDLGIEA